MTAPSCAQELRHPGTFPYVPTGQGSQGSGFQDGSGVRLYQQNVSIGLDPNEVMAQPREFESAVLRSGPSSGPGGPGSSEGRG